MKVEILGLPRGVAAGNKVGEGWIVSWTGDKGRATLSSSVIDMGPEWQGTNGRTRIQDRSRKTGENTARD